MIKLTCNNCESSLSIPSDEVRFITCAACHQKLEVVQDQKNETFFTKVVTTPTNSNTLSMQLKEWDEWWEQKKTREYLIEPTETNRFNLKIAAAVTAAFWVAVPILFFVGMETIETRWMVYSFMFFVTALFSTVYNYRRHVRMKEYKINYNKYEQRRQELLQKMEAPEK